MAYNKMELQAAGGLLINLVQALSDGIDAGDIAEGTEFLVALSGLADDIKADPDAAILDILSGATSAFADMRRDVPVDG